jgi:hypothetical protein
VTVLVAALVAAVTSAAMTALLQNSANGGETLTQEGTGMVRHEPMEIYYPLAYASPPHLVVSGPNSNLCVIVEQRPDHFKVKRVSNVAMNAVEITWKAEGRRGFGNR